MSSYTQNYPRLIIPVDDIRQASPLMWWTSLSFLALFVLWVVLANFDSRLFNGISVWVKPAKFALSLAVHMLTLAFGIALLPIAVRNGRWVNGAAFTMASMSIFELAYIAFRASRGEASHFNASSELAQLLYSAMGLGAAAMMVATAILGMLILRHGGRSLLAQATGSSFILAASLTLVIGFTLGGMGSHWIGGDQTDATGLPIMGWSTTGGDLRVSHFLGLHMMQVLPAVALFGSRRLLAGATAAGILITIAAYAQALMGLPVIPL
jgi:hypothetical protein